MSWPWTPFLLSVVFFSLTTKLCTKVNKIICKSQAHLSSRGLIYELLEYIKYVDYLIQNRKEPWSLTPVSFKRYRKVVLNNCTKGVKEMYTARKQQCPNRSPKGLSLTTKDSKLTANLGKNVTFLVHLDEVRTYPGRTQEHMKWKSVLLSLHRTETSGWMMFCMQSCDRAFWWNNYSRSSLATWA